MILSVKSLYDIFPYYELDIRLSTGYYNLLILNYYYYILSLKSSFIISSFSQSYYSP